MLTVALLVGIPFLAAFAFFNAIFAWEHLKYHREMGWRLGDFWYELPSFLLASAGVLLQLWCVVTINL